MPSSAQARLRAQRLGERSALAGRAAEALGRRDVELEQHGQALSERASGCLRERHAGLEPIDALHHVEQLRDRLRLVRLHVPDEVLAYRRQRRELARRASCT